MTPIIATPHLLEKLYELGLCPPGITRMVIDIKLAELVKVFHTGYLDEANIDVILEHIAKEMKDENHSSSSSGKR